MVKVDARIFFFFFCFISVVLIKHMFEDLNIFYCFKIPYVTNFTIINEKVTLLCKNIVLSHGKLNFYSSSKIQMLQLVIQVTHKS